REIDHDCSTPFHRRISDSRLPQPGSDWASPLRTASGRLGNSEARHTQKSVNPLPRLYAIADSSFSNPVHAAQALFDAGVRLIQVRNKTSSARQLLDQVERIIQLAPSDAAVIVNDRPDIARLAQAAGVHLGQTDMPAGAARLVLGEGQLLGLSTHKLE